MSPYIHSLLATIYRDLGNPNQAISESLKSLRYNPDQEDLLYNLGIFCEEANRFDEAIVFLKQYKEKVRGEKKKRAESLISLLEEEKVKSKMYPSNSSDYLDKLTAEDNVNRWPKKKMPLKVYIQPSSRARGFQPQFPEIAREAFIAWYRASKKKVAFKFVDSLDEADINLEWTDKRLRTNNDKRERMKAGLTTSTATVSGIIKKARIQVRTLNPFTKKGTPEDQVVETCLHEIGHSLGLNGHSTNQSDIMYLGVTKRQLPALTRRDKATISKLYKAYAVVAMAGVKDKKKSVANIHSPPPITISQPDLSKAAKLPLSGQSTAGNSSPPQTQGRPPGQSTAGNSPLPQTQGRPPGQSTAYMPTYPGRPYGTAAMPPYTTPPYVQPAYPAQAYRQPVYVQPAPQAYYYVPVPAYQQPAPQINYAPPVIQQQVATPYPVQQPYYQQYTGTYPTQPQYMNQVAPQPQYSMTPGQQGQLGQQGQNNAVPQSLKMIDNIFQNLKPKLQQFMNGTPQGAGSTNTFQQSQPYQQ